MASPQLEKVVGLLRERPRDPRADVARRRRGMEAVAFPVATDVAVEPTSIAGQAAEWVTAPGAAVDARVVLYLHGGGFVMGSPSTHRKLAGDLSRAAAARVLLLDYPLAPERPFPAAIDAIAAAYVVLARETPAARIVIAGDSAGGGLTIAALLALRDAGVPLPAAAVAISPWVDLVRASAVSPALVAADPVVGLEDLNAFRDWYLQGANPADPAASPVRADLRGLPSLLIHVGAAEILVDDATVLAARARAAGVDVTLQVWPEMIHVWHVFAGRVPEATEAVARVGEFVRRHVPARGAAR
jgi:acetyl esterase/lipase